MTASYPLTWPEGWPRTPSEKRKSSSHFQTTFTRAQRDLLFELDRLKAKNIVISSWLPVKTDGTLRADAARRKIEDPGVSVFFQRDGHPFVMARDLYWNVHDNLRSIGLAIEHLRGMERHGGAIMMNRAFDGFLALPAPEPKRHWTEVLGVTADAEIWMIEAAHKHHAKTRHPDQGGSEVEMSELNTARDQAIKERS